LQPVRGVSGRATVTDSAAAADGASYALERNPHSSIRSRLCGSS